MRLTFHSERVLAVTAHPDDAELLCAGTLARARADGADVAICLLCQGDKGQPPIPIPRLAQVRQKEAARAAHLLKARLLIAGFPDGALRDGPDERTRLIDIFRQFRPTLLLAHSPEDYHPDHRAASALADAVSWFSASRGHPSKSDPLPLPPAIWWMDTINMNGFAPGFYVDISAHVALKERMLDCHESQIHPDASSSLMEIMRLQYRARGAQAGVAAAEAFRIHHAFKRTAAW